MLLAFALGACARGQLTPSAGSSTSPSEASSAPSSSSGSRETFDSIADLYSALPEYRFQPVGMQAEAQRRMDKVRAAGGDVIEDVDIKALVDAKAKRALKIGSSVVMFRSGLEDELAAQRDSLASGLLGGVPKKKWVAGDQVYIASVANFHFVVLFLDDRFAVVLRGFKRDELLEVAENFITTYPQ